MENENKSTENDNIFELYLKVLSKNLKTERTFKLFRGRLYSRLHDKRVKELNLNGILNVSYLFIVLIKCGTSTIELVSKIN
jgi:hypothetical protein